MKINHFGNVNFNPYKKQMEKLDQLQKGGAKKDQIEISSVAKELQQGSKIETERQEKIDAIKQQVESGEYKVDPEKLARKMYDFWNQ